MKLFSVATLLVVVASSVNAILVNTPVGAVVCQPLLITWDPQDSAGPFFLSIVPGDSPTSPALFSWSDLTGTSFTWNVVEPAGTSLEVLLRDQTGAIAQSASFAVLANTNTSCLNSNSTSLPPSTSLPTTTTTTLNPATAITTAIHIPTTTPGASGGSPNRALSNGCLFAAFVGAFMV